MFGGWFGERVFANDKRLRFWLEIYTHLTRLFYSFHHTNGLLQESGQRRNRSRGTYKNEKLLPWLGKSTNVESKNTK